jgi:predicted DNA-binding transcriptional regulator YafY
MSDPSARTLRLLSLLQSHRYWTGADLAERLAVSVRTVRRDVDRLRELGYPVEASPGVDGGYQLAPGAVLPPLVLDDEEAVALAVGLQLAAETAVAGIADSSVRALAKVVQVMPRRLTEQVQALLSATVSMSWPTSSGSVGTSVLTTLAQACRDSERVEFGYTSAAGEVTERRVEPLRLVRLGQRWYVVAYDLARHDWRSFRLDRLDEPVRSGVRFLPRELPAADAAEFVRAGIGATPASYSVEALIEAPAGEVSARIGRWARIDDAGRGRSRLRMTTDSLDWAALALGAVGADFTVVEPPELRTHLREWAHRFARATNSISVQDHDQVLGARAES